MTLHSLLILSSIFLAWAHTLEHAACHSYNKRKSLVWVTHPYSGSDQQVILEDWRMKNKTQWLSHRKNPYKNKIGSKRCYRGFAPSWKIMLSKASDWGVATQWAPGRTLAPCYHWVCGAVRGVLPPSGKSHAGIQDGCVANHVNQLSYSAVRVQFENFYHEFSFSPKLRF